MKHVLLLRIFKSFAIRSKCICVRTRSIDFAFFYDFSIGFGTVLAWYFFVFHFMVWGKKFSICASNFKILNFVASVFMNNTHE
jgi:hypothetical protein